MNLTILQKAFGIIYMFICFGHQARVRIGIFNMFSKISSKIQVLGMCVTVAAFAGAVALPGTRATQAVNQPNAGVAGTSSTAMLEIYQNQQKPAAGMSFASTDPSIYHHWATNAPKNDVADVDPEIYHHWRQAGGMTTVANVDPDIYHHWRRVSDTTTVAAVVPAIYHHWS